MESLNYVGKKQKRSGKESLAKSLWNFTIGIRYLGVVCNTACVIFLCKLWNYNYGRIVVFSFYSSWLVKYMQNSKFKKLFQPNVTIEIWLHTWHFWYLKNLVDHLLHDFLQFELVPIWDTLHWPVILVLQWGWSIAVLLVFHNFQTWQICLLFSFAMICVLESLKVS